VVAAVSGNVRNTMTANQDNTLSRHRWPKPLRIVKARPRLFICFAIGLLVFLALSATGWRIVSRLLVGWDVFVVSISFLRFK